MKFPKFILLNFPTLIVVNDVPNCEIIHVSLKNAKHTYIKTFRILRNKTRIFILFNTARTDSEHTDYDKNCCIEVIFKSNERILTLTSKNIAIIPNPTSDHKRELIKTFKTKLDQLKNSVEILPAPMPFGIVPFSIGVGELSTDK